MDRDRIAGAAKQAKGAVKEAAGKLTGDVKLNAEGKADKAEGKLQTPSAARRMQCGTRCRSSGTPA